MHQLPLLDDELDVILPLVDSIRAEHGGADDPRLIEMAPRYARKLPRRVRLFLDEYRIAEPSAFCILSGFPVDDGVIGPTPVRGKPAARGSPGLAPEVFFLLCATQLGDISAEPGQPGRRIMHDMLPGRADPAGNQASPWWRTEDPSSRGKADYAGLMCLRNSDDVATTICDVDWIDWSLLDVDLLFEPEYPVRAANGAAGRREGSAKRPVLSGDRGRPCLSLDLDSMVRDEMAPAARAAFDAFTRAIDLALNGLMLWSARMRAALRRATPPTESKIPPMNQPPC